MWGAGRPFLTTRGPMVADTRRDRLSPIDVECSGPQHGERPTSARLYISALRPGASRPSEVVFTLGLGSLHRDRSRAEPTGVKREM